MAKEYSIKIKGKKQVIAYYCTKCRRNHNYGASKLYNQHKKYK